MTYLGLKERLRPLHPLVIDVDLGHVPEDLKESRSLVKLASSRFAEDEQKLYEINKPSAPVQCPPTVILFVKKAKQYWIDCLYYTYNWQLISAGVLSRHYDIVSF